MPVNWCGGEWNGAYLGARELMTLYPGKTSGTASPIECSTHSCGAVVSAGRDFNRIGLLDVKRMIYGTVLFHASAECFSWSSHCSLPGNAGEVSKNLFFTFFPVGHLASSGSPWTTASFLVGINPSSLRGCARLGKEERILSCEDPLNLCRWGKQAGIQPGWCPCQTPPPPDRMSEEFCHMGRMFKINGP